MTIKIRPADESDVYWICTQLKKFSDFYNSKYPLYDDPDFAAFTMGNIIENHFVLMACEEKSKTRVGFIAGLETKHFFNPNINVLSELFWWVDEEYRGSRAGLLLLNEFIKHGEEKFQWIQFTLEHKSPVSDQTLVKKGFKLQEKSFLREI